MAIIHQTMQKKNFAKVNYCAIISESYGRIAQLVRASLWRREGRGFEFLFAHHKNKPLIRAIFYGFTDEVSAPRRRRPLKKISQKQTQSFLLFTSLALQDDEECSDTDRSESKDTGNQVVSSRDVERRKQRACIWNVWRIRCGIVKFDQSGTNS